MLIIATKGSAGTHRQRYADDFVVLVHGEKADAEALFGEVADVLAPMGLRLSEEKTHLTHIDDGFDFLGWRIQRRTWRGRGGVRKTVYTYPSKKSLASIKAKIRLLTRRNAHRTLADLLRRINPAIRGWCTYFQHGVSKRTFSYVDHVAFWRIVGWSKNATQAEHAHRDPPPPARMADRGGRDRALPSLAGPGDPLPLPRNPHPEPMDEHPNGMNHTESRMLRNGHVRFGGRAGETHQPQG